MKWIGIDVNRIAKALALLVLSICLTGNSTFARISRNLGADIRVGYSNTEQDSLKQENVDQEYNLTWNKILAKGLIVKSGLYYYNFGTSQNTGGNSWRSEFAPNGEVQWSTSWMGASLHGSRRENRSNDRSSHLFNESVGFTARSQITGLPWLKLRLQQDNLYNKANLADRDTRDRIGSGTIGYLRGSTSISYGYTYKNTLNHSQLVEQTSHLHNFQLDKSETFYQNRIRSTFSYNFNYKTDTDKNLDNDALQIELNQFFGLYAEDATPDLGSLDTIQSLIDGNVVLPVVPLINIGGNNVNQNIGVDLGFSQELNRVHLYTDRPSGNNVRWTVMRSSDNSIWEAVSNPISSYSPGFMRYEIEFPTISTRYIKIINNGLNEVDSAFVTEIVALRDTRDAGTVSRTQQVHTASLNNSVVLSNNWSGNAGISMRRDGGNAVSRGRNETYYSFGLRNTISAALTQSASTQLGYIDYETTTYDVDRTFLGIYDLRYRPLTTLDFSLSLTHRDNYILSVKSQEINNAILRMRGEVLPRLTVRNELGGGRNTMMSSNTRYDTWTFLTAWEGQVNSRIDAIATYSYQRSKDLQGVVRVKNQYGLIFGYQVTNNIQFRGNLDLTNDGRTRNLTQDYAVSWMMTPKLSAGASISLSQFQNGVDSRSERYNAQLEYMISHRTALSGSYSENDLSSAGGESGRSFRVGLRTGW